MLSSINKWNGKKQYSFIPICIILTVLFFLNPFDIIREQDNYLFIVFSIIPFLLYLLSSTNIISLTFKLVKFDFYFLLFITLSMVSGIWSDNVGLSLFDSITWLSYWLWIPIFRSIDYAKHQDAISKAVIVLLIFFIAIMLYGTFQYMGWVKITHYNENYICTIILSLLVFLWNFRTDNNTSKIIKVTLTLLVLIILYHQVVRALLVAFGILAIITIHYYNHKKIKYAVYTIFAVILLSTLINPNKSRINLIDDGNLQNADRPFMMQQSFRLFKEKPLLGYGAGTSIINSYKYGSDDSFKMNNPNMIVRVENHDLYSKMLSEVGLVGFIPFIIAFITLLKTIYDRWHDANYIEKSSTNIIVLFLILFSVYLCIRFRQFYFSGPLMILMIAIGVISNYQKELSISKKYLRSILVFLSLVSVAWQVWINPRIIKAYDARLIETHSLEKRIDLLNNSIHKYFNCLESDPLSLTLGFFYQSYGDRQLAKEHFEQAIEVAPYNDKALYAYAHYLYRHENNIEESQYYLDRSFNIQSNSYRKKILQAKLLIQQEKYQEALSYLEFLTHFEENMLRKDFAKLYGSNAIDFYEEERDRYNELIEIIKPYIFMDMHIEKYRLLIDLSIKENNCEKIINYYETYRFIGGAATKELKQKYAACRKME